MLVIYSFYFLLPISVYSLFLTLLFLFQDRIFYAFCLFCYSVSFITLSFLILFFLLFCLYVILSFLLFCLYIILSFLLFCLFYYFVFMSFCLLSFCLFSCFCRTSFPLFSLSFWLHFYPFICLFFDIFAWIFKYIKMLLSFYFFVCLSTLFLFSFIIYVIDFLI